MRIYDFDGWLKDNSFIAVVRCEHCRHYDRIDGKDTIFFWHSVLPMLECKNCKNIAAEDYNADSERIKFLEYTAIVPHMLIEKNLIEEYKYAR